MILLNPFIFFKKTDSSFKFFGLNTTFAGPPRLNHEYFDRFSSNKTKLFLYTISFFILSWVAQFIGHYIEGKRPALVDNLSQAFIDAPLFSMDYLLICE